MRAAFLTGIRELEVREAPDPVVTEGDDVLLQVDAVGVCGSDVHYYTTGRIGCQVVQHPWVCGHEPSATVLEVGADVTGLAPGQRVAVEPAISCMACDQCLAGRPHTCRKLRFISCPGERPGAFSERIVMPARNCYPIPDDLSAAEGAVMEPLSIGLYAARLASVRPGAKVAILGSGPIGLCVLLALRAETDCTVYATDRLDPRLAVARQCGADWTGNPDSQDVVAAITDAEPGLLDVVFECAGEQDTLDQGLHLLKPGGTLMMIGIPEVDRVSFAIDLLRRKELRLQNVRRQCECVAPAIALAASGQVDVSPLITHRFPLDDAKAAFDLAADYRDGVVKAVVEMGTSERSAP